MNLDRESVAKMLRGAWIADEPIPSAGTWDDLGPIMRKAWMATADAVIELVRGKVIEAVVSARAEVGTHLEIAARVMKGTA